MKEMERGLDVQREVWQRTLHEIEHSQEIEKIARHPCVICLDDVSERAVLIPCRHDQFDFLCLASWLEERTQCPLCKSDIQSVHYGIHSPTDFQVYTIHNTKSSSVPNSVPTWTARQRPPARRSRQLALARPASPDSAIRRRREVYRQLLYSQHVGSNRISRFRALTPTFFAQDSELVSRARMWIRRELRVFEYLDPLSEDAGGAGLSAASAIQGSTVISSKRGTVRGNNAEFLLEYIIAILKTINIRDASGQPEDMLQEFLGRAHARLFLHELGSWLRSPYTSLEAWDRHVQYEESREANVDPESGGLSRKRRREEGGNEEGFRRRGNVNSRTRGYDSYRPSY